MTEKRQDGGKYWELYKRLLAFALLGLFALFYLGHFIAFIIFGPVTVDEPNKVILWSEIILLVSVMALAVDCFINAVRKKKSKNNKEGKERFKLKDGSN